MQPTTDTNMTSDQQSYLRKKEYLLLGLFVKFWNMHCSDDAEKLQLDNLLCFMLHELDFLGINSSLLWIRILSVRSVQL